MFYLGDHHRLFNHFNLDLVGFIFHFLFFILNNFFLCIHNLDFLFCNFLVDFTLNLFVILQKCMVKTAKMLKHAVHYKKPCKNWNQIFQAGNVGKNQPIPTSSSELGCVISAHLSPRERLMSRLLLAAAVIDESES